MRCRWDIAATHRLCTYRRTGASRSSICIGGGGEAYTAEAKAVGARGKSNASASTGGAGHLRRAAQASSNHTAPPPSLPVPGCRDRTCSASELLTAWLGTGTTLGDRDRTQCKQSAASVRRVGDNCVHMASSEESSELYWDGGVPISAACQGGKMLQRRRHSVGVAHCVTSEGAASLMGSVRLLQSGMAMTGHGSLLDPPRERVIVGPFSAVADAEVVARVRSINGRFRIQ